MPPAPSICELRQPLRLIRKKADYLKSSIIFLMNDTLYFYIGAQNSKS